MSTRQARVVGIKFRDIPFSEAVKCYSFATEEDWAAVRGTMTQVKVPLEIYEECDRGGPKYLTGQMSKMTPGLPAAICPHIAEIGD